MVLKFTLDLGCWCYLVHYSTALWGVFVSFLRIFRNPFISQGTQIWFLSSLYILSYWLNLGLFGFQKKRMIVLLLESPPVLLLPLLSPWLTAEGTLRAQIPISLLIAVVSYGEHHTCFLFFSLLCCILVPNHFIGSGGDARIFTESGWWERAAI